MSCSVLANGLNESVPKSCLNLAKLVGAHQFLPCAGHQVAEPVGQPEIVAAKVNITIWENNSTILDKIPHAAYSPLSEGARL
jgi:hypothetical protein